MMSGSRTALIPPGQRVMGGCQCRIALLEKIDRHEKGLSLNLLDGWMDAELMMLKRRPLPLDHLVLSDDPCFC